MVEKFSSRVPVAVGKRIDPESGDKIRWTTTEDGELSVELVQQQYGVLDDTEPVDMGETNAVEVETVFGAESDSQRSDS